MIVSEQRIQETKRRFQIKKIKEKLKDKSESLVSLVNNTWFVFYVRFINAYVSRNLLFFSKELK